jgi:hypothetical protein
MPVPMVIELADPESEICTTRNPSVGPVSTSRLKTELLRIEGLGAVHVRDRDRHELELQFNHGTFWRSDSELPRTCLSMSPTNVARAIVPTTLTAAATWSPAVKASRAASTSAGPT